jgi:predicted ester cyclase
VSGRAVLVLCVAIAGCAGERPAPVTSRSAEVGQEAEADRNKMLVRRMFEDLWNKKDPDAALLYFAPDVVNHAAVPSAQGAEGMRTIARKLFAAFPDHATKIEDVVAEKDRVYVRVISEGTHTNPLEFATPVPPSGKHIRMEQVHEFRVQDGKIVETWMTMDKQEFARQSGR